MTWRSDIIAHMLRLFGVVDAGIGSRSNAPAKLLLSDRPDATAVAELLYTAEAGGTVIAMQPGTEFVAALGVRKMRKETERASMFKLSGRTRFRWQRRLRTLHAYDIYEGEGLDGLVIDELECAAWVRRPIGRGAIILVGTDLPSDLMRYRQGDAARAATRQQGRMWGFEGERPVYLFEEQLEGESPFERHADWWVAALARVTVDVSGCDWVPMLPGGAPGAVVITGDDDQAFLETYAEQQRVLDGAPITYFLHPATRHDGATLAELREGGRVHLALHPDALDAPERYAAILDTQVGWYQNLVGERADMVRNHGFLNDGYWGHVGPWMAAGLRYSSNLPGLDGRALNGSYLPARLALEGRLTSHWSVLTTIGDGVMYALGMDAVAARRCILDTARRIRESGVPGIIILNLHPQNIDRTRCMHDAALEVVRDGFVAWNLRDCFDWFERLDRGDVSSRYPAGRPRASRPGFWSSFRAWLHQADGWMT